MTRLLRGDKEPYDWLGVWTASDRGNAKAHRLNVLNVGKETKTTLKLEYTAENDKTGILYLSHYAAVFVASALLGNLSLGAIEELPTEAKENLRKLCKMLLSATNDKVDGTETK